MMVICILTVTGHYASAQCSISGWTSVCAGNQKQYKVTGLAPYLPQFSVSPASAVSGAFTIDDTYTVTWNSTFFSGCTGTATITATDGLGHTCTLPVTVYAKPAQGGIMTNPPGTTLVKPVNGYTNELPEVEYEISAACYSNINWTTPTGWNIISGQGTKKIRVKPANNSACSGTIQVDVYGNIGGCNNTETISVSHDPVADGTITNNIQTVGSWLTLEICPDDDVIMDGSSSSFCNYGNNNIYVELMESDASWNVLSSQGMWLTEPQYNVFGGLDHFDVKAFGASLNPAFNLKPNKYYMLKLAVGGGPQWNERTMHIEVKPIGAPAPTYADAIVLNPLPPNVNRTVRARWQGDPLKVYEIYYQVSDACSFPVASTTTDHFISCFTPTYYSPGLVYLDIPGLPALHKFRYKVRECNCGIWTNWMTTTPCLTLPKPGPNSVANTLETEKQETYVYPNPFSENFNAVFHLSSPSSVMIKVLDITGKVIKTIPKKTYPVGENSVEINTSQLQAGVYTVVINTDNDIYNHKIICNK